MYHLVCDILVKHTDGTYLLMKRALNKHLGGLWEATAGGSALTGESPIVCAQRELNEETGVNSGEFFELGKVTNIERNTIYIEYLCITNCDKKQISLQEGETIDFMWITAEMLKSMKNELASVRILRFLKELI